MPRRILALLAAILLLACAVSLAEEEENGGDMTRIDTPVVLPLVGMSADEALSAPENRALFGAAAFLEADLESGGLPYDEWLGAHPCYLGTVEGLESLVFVATNGKTILEVFCRADGSFAMFGTIDYSIAPPLADQLVEESVKRSCETWFVIPAEDIPAAVETLSGLAA